MLVSVIIPVYNAEKYLEECIDSVLKQDLEDFEIILVNDGSTDSSGDICNLYAAKDNRITVFHKTNGGVSAARNMGIENASGTWLTFLDSDDSLQKRYFESLKIKDNVDWIHLLLTREIPSYFQNEINYHEQLYSVSQFVEKYSLYPHFPEACGKFFRKSVIDANNIKFDIDLKFGEDSVFNLQYLRLCKTIYTSNSSKYEYRNATSVLSKLNYDVKNDSKLFTIIEHELELYPYPKEFCNQTIKIPLTRYLKILYFDKSITKTTRRMLLKEVVLKYFEIILDIYTHFKIKSFFILAYYTSSYRVLDYVLCKLYQKNER